MFPHLPPLLRLLDRTPPAPRTLLWPFAVRSSRPFLFHFDGGPALFPMAGGGRIPVPGTSEAARMQVPPMQSVSPQMGPNYEHSLEIRRYTTASAAGFDGDQDVAIGGNTTHVDAAASASGAHPSDVGASRGSSGGPSNGPRQGDQHYYRRPA